MGQAGGMGGGALPNWGGPQAGAGAPTTAVASTGATADVPWYAASNYGTATPTAGPTSTPGALYQPVSGDRVNMSAREAYRAPPPAAVAGGVGTRNQVGPVRFVNGTWTTFPSNHPQAPDYTGQNPGDWAAYGPQMYVPPGQKAQYSGTAKKGKK